MHFSPLIDPTMHFSPSILRYKYDNDYIHKYKYILVALGAQELRGIMQYDRIMDVIIVM